MALIFITGSTDGLGRGAAQSLMDDGHQIVLHARSKERAAALDDLAGRAAGVVIGDLSSERETRSVAEQVNAIGVMDAVIHNAGTYLQRERGATPEGHAITFAVNVLAPYLLTALITRPKRLVYLSSGLHRGADASLDDVDWSTRPWDAGQAYADSKLMVMALAFALARRWPDVTSNAVSPGWVATKMGGPSATDDFDDGYLTQTWLAVSDEPKAKQTGGYWRLREQQDPLPVARDMAYQDWLIDKLREITGVALL